MFAWLAEKLHIKGSGEIELDFELPPSDLEGSPEIRRVNRAVVTAATEVITQYGEVIKLDSSNGAFVENGDTLVIHTPEGGIKKVKLDKAKIISDAGSPRVSIWKAIWPDSFR